MVIYMDVEVYLERLKMFFQNKKNQLRRKRFVLTLFRENEHKKSPIGNHASKKQLIYFTRYCRVCDMWQAAYKN